MTMKGMFEWECWQELCALLLDLEAVTKADLKSPKSECDTKGKVLLAKIREWGDAFADLRNGGQGGA